MLFYTLNSNTNIQNFLSPLCIYNIMYNKNEINIMAKITNKLLEGTIAKVLREYLDYDEVDPMLASDALNDEMMDKYAKEYPEEFEKEFGKNKRPNWSSAPSEHIDNLPFESKKNNRRVIKESQLRNFVRNTIISMLNESFGNYPAGAANDPRAPWNEPDSAVEKMDVYGTAYYYNEETDEEKRMPFDITVEVKGEYVTDADEEGYSSVFEPYNDTDWQSLVMDSGEIPETLEGGFKLEDIEIEGKEY
jgi:hypothetical protein